MTQTTNAPYGQLIEPTVLKLERLLPGPVARVWDYLTKSELRRQWLASGDMDLTPGTEFEFVWRNDELTDPPGARPEGMGAENRMTCKILEVDAPHRLLISWGVQSDVLFELAGKGSDTLLTITHRRPPTHDMLLSVSAGWHSHVDVLAAKLAGTKPAPHWDNWVRLKTEYAQRFPE
ncbi:MAG: SRPBCC family protein [Hyphomonas sp.]|uniref:SRPBCC family protein n=1 Tax=Hyphomonas sp. TaxID=87 RepID=UPI001852AC75|nr:SRPBCC family protein [Hyphomonas sp.]MBA3070527.1 SRPBCC family protein [Hyphomonas sp.]MBU3920584.1 SRPBCC family protein [Alphaproteobacteria bacterium]MBU4062057.1 SRPBCC family protein [Alphaproteobacteria bacterium]MBU4164993.1 SRPBCC family protein [Alphaproteobacteria bacterium]